ncbi:MAG: hypothetical protein NC124_20720 [Clostridium sp.]|nr:hypothetical protein [Clostridium sp.]
MAIVEKNGLKFLDGLNSDYIVIESSCLEKYISYIKKYKVKGVYLCSIYFDLKNIDFLNHCNSIEKINLNCSSIDDYSGLYYLQNLKELILQESRGVVDLGRISQLEMLIIDMKNKSITGLDKMEHLESLTLYHYNPKSRDLTELRLRSAIRSLSLVQSSIETLKGCEKFIHLEVLECYYLSKLCDIRYIQSNAKTLQVLKFEVCKKIRNHEVIAELCGLEQLMFTNCGDISSIQFIEDMPQLRSFTFMKTNIIDGNLYPCERLEYVAFSNKKHYSHKCFGLNNNLRIQRK